MQVALHSHYFHLAIVILVVLDALIVLFELLLDVGAFSKSYHALNTLYDWVVLLDNIECEGDDLLEQAERCHYSRDFRAGCAAPVPLPKHPDFLPEVVSINNNTPAVLCTCKFRDGKRVCVNC